MRKLLNVFEFFKTTLVTNLAVSLSAVLFGGWDYFFIYFLSLGFFTSLVIKEFYRKNDYLFYANNGISKLQLFVFSYLMTCVCAVVFGFFSLLKHKLF